MPRAEIERRVNELRRRQEARAAERCVEVEVMPSAVLTPEVTALVVAGRRLRRDETEGNWERFSLALDEFDGVL